MTRAILVVMLISGTAWANPHPHDRDDGSGGTNTSPPTVTSSPTLTASPTSTVRVEGDDYPVSSAASLNMGACKAGGSGQLASVGFAIGVSESFCLVLAAAYAATNACVTMPSIPVTCGGGSELPPIDYDAEVRITPGIYLGTNPPAEDTPLDELGVGPMIVLIDEAHPIECHQVNPVCDLVPWYWDQVENETKAVVGFWGWRWRVKQFLPSIIAWIP